MRKEDYTNYLQSMRLLHSDVPNWQDFASAWIADYLPGDRSQYANALCILGADVYALLSSASEQNCTLTTVLGALYDEYTQYGFSYAAYRFVTRIMADLLDKNVDIPIESIGEELYDGYFDPKGDTIDEPTDAGLLKRYRNKLLDFSKTNQLVHFRKYDRSCIGISYPACNGFLESLLQTDRMWFVGWEELKLTQISECSMCGRQFFKKYRAQTAHLSTECPVCDAGKRTKHVKPLPEAPVFSDTILVRCKKCAKENRVLIGSDVCTSCSACGEILTFSSYPMADPLKLKSAVKKFCIADKGDSIVQKAAGTLFKRARNLELNFGLHSLYAACGFLRWFSRSGQEYRSPLLLLKIDLILDKAKGKYCIALDKTDDEAISVNRTLFKMLSGYSGEVSIELPIFGKGQSFDDYIIDVKRKLAEYTFTSDWCIEEQIAIGIFHYQKLQLETDLSENFDVYLSHPIVRSLIGAEIVHTDASSSSLETEKPLLVLDADSSQECVIKTAASGESFILQGPPGTGKSQTLTNVIAGAMGEGKSVLFVTEKASAREIIWDNLSRLTTNNGRALTDFVFNAAHITTSGGKRDADKPGKESIKNFYNNRFDALSPYFTSDVQTDDIEYLHGRIRKLYDDLDQEYKGRRVKDWIVCWADHAHYRQIALDPSVLRELHLSTAEDMISAFYRLSEKFGVLYSAHPLYGYTESRSSLDSVPLMDALTQHIDALQEIVKKGREQFGLKLDTSYRHLGSDAKLISRRGELPPQIHKWIREGKLQDVSNGRSLRNKLIQIRDYARTRQEKRDAIRALPMFQYENHVTNHFYSLNPTRLYNELLDYGNPFKRLTGKYKALAETVRTAFAAVKDKMNYKECLQACEKLVLMQNAHEKKTAYVADFNKDADMVFEYAVGWETDWDEIIVWLSEAIDNLEEEGTPTENEIYSYLLGAQTPALALPLLKEYGNELSCAVQNVVTLVDKLAVYFDPTILDIGNWQTDKIQQHMDSILRYRDMLGDWARLQAFLNKMKKEANIDYIHSTLLKEGILNADDAIGSLRRAYYKEMVFLAIRKCAPDLEDFTREEHESLLKQYAQADLNGIQINIVRLYSMLSRRKEQVCAEYARNRRGKLIRSVKGISVKQILKDNWECIRSITPCFMMSPLNVSRYLDIGITFDMVIFDEASQIFLEDALASVVRGKQVIISGDRQQLPPCDFFRANDPDAEQTDIYDEETEPVGRSVLDASLNSQIDTVSLQWHYRSRDESLICFSNKMFYDDSLVTFPAAKEDPSLRLIYHPVTDGRYTSGKQNINAKEAEEIVRLIWEEICSDERRHFTLGVVAFSVTQAEEIEDRFWEFVNSDAAVQAKFREWEAMEEHQKEPIIFCNLDTIQGDERDTMIVSTTYGKTPDGNFGLRFLGPIRQDGGKKRLNVAITRARCRMLVVTSMTADMLQKELRRSEGRCNGGAEVLCDFLRYAESYKDAHRYPIPRQDASVFIKSICRWLDQNGICYDLGVGMSSCKIDIAIKRNRDDRDYVLGIVTDERGLFGQSVREYARLRDHILTCRYAWNLYHVWMGAWFFDYEKEKAELMCRIREMLQTE